MGGIRFEIEHFEHHSERELLLEILKGQREIMADFTALNAAVAQLQTDVDSLLAAGQAGAADQASVDAATAAVQAVDASVQAALPAPAPAP